MNIALWIVQGLLALLFLFAGGMKLVMPIEEMTKEVAMPGLFLRFIGVCELLGGIGLFMSMDKMIGDQFDKGLADMKSVVEAQPVQSNATASDQEEDAR